MTNNVCLKSCMWENTQLLGGYARPVTSHTSEGHVQREPAYTHACNAMLHFPPNSNTCFPDLSNSNVPTHPLQHKPLQLKHMLAMMCCYEEAAKGLLHIREEERHSTIWHSTKGCSTKGRSTKGRSTQRHSTRRQGKRGICCNHHSLEARSIIRHPTSSSPFIIYHPIRP